MLKYIPILFLFTASAGFAQSPDSLTAFALQNNAELRRLQIEYRAAGQRPAQVRQLPDPQAGVGVFPLPVQTRTGSQIVRISLQQMFPWKGTLDSRVALEQTKADLIAEQAAARTVELRYEVKKAWIQLYEMRKIRRTLRRQIELLRNREQIILAGIETGKAGAADVVLLQLRIETLQTEIALLREKETEPLTDLNRLLNRNLQTPVGTPDTLLPSDIAFNETAFLQDISEQHPALRIYLLQQEAAHDRLKINALSGKPALGVGADYIAVNGYDGSELAANGRDIVQLKAMVNVPLYRGKYAAKEREERFIIEALEVQKQDKTEQFKAAVIRAAARYRSATLRLNLYRKQQELIAASRRLLLAEYTARGNRFGDLLDLEMQLIEVEMHIIKAETELYLAQAETERYTGFFKK